MDLFELLILALFALPALLRWVEKSRKRSRVDTGGDGTVDARGDTAGESAFERALREIGVALEQEPAPAKVPASSDEPRSKRTDSGFSREERFERKVSQSPKPAPGVSEVPFRELEMARINLPYTIRHSTVDARTRSLRKTLRTPLETRRAFLLAEILGPPVSLRRPSR